ncbi:MAG: hypothetical protein WAV47_02105 [Blastocatellia bacterium]
MVSVASKKTKKHLQIADSKPKAEPDTSVRNKSLYIALASLVIVVGVCYANALGNGFVFDDHGHVLSNKSFRSLTNLPKLLVASYRPLRDISYALDFALWGERPFGFHLTSILIHLGNTLIVMLLMRRLTRDIIPASIAALIFAVHPIQVDAVTYVSGRRDVLFSLFYLVSFHSYLTYRRLADNRDQRSSSLRAFLFFALFLVCWALSLLSKEMAASMPLVIFLWNFCDVWDKQGSNWGRQLFNAIKKTLRRDRWLYLTLSLAVPAYVWYQVFVKGGSMRARMSGFDYWGGSFYTNLLTSIRVQAWFLKQLVFPTPIVQYSGAFDIAATILEWRVILSVIVVGATLAAGFVLLNKDRLLAFAILSYFALLVPVSQIIPHHELLADHYLYLPMMSFGLFVALLARKVASRSEMFKRISYAAAGAVVIVFAVMTVMRNPVYKDDLALWKTNYQEVPNSVRAVSSLAGRYATSYPGRAAELYKQCIALDPAYAPAYGSLAFLYQTKDKARETEQLVLKGLSLPDSQMVSPGYENPNRFKSELTTALALAKGFQGFQKEAEDLLLKAIDMYPSNSQPYSLLAGYYHPIDRQKELAILGRQVTYFPNDYYSLQAISYRLIEDKRYDDASPYLERILAIVPNDFYGSYQLGQIYRSKSDCAKARSYMAIARTGAADADDIKAVDGAMNAIRQQCGE